MAGTNSSRLWRPKKGRRGGNLPRTHTDERVSGYVRKSSGKTANGNRRDDRVASIQSNGKFGKRKSMGSDAIRVDRHLLKSVAGRLETAATSAVVCRLALSGQNADCDQEIAKVLQWFVTDELKRQIASLDQIIQSQSKAGRSKQGRQQAARLDGSINAETSLVRRGVLSDVRHRLSVVAACTTACRRALEEQNAEQDMEIASMLNRAVIDVVYAQISRIHRISIRRQKRETPKSRTAQ